MLQGLPRNIDLNVIGFKKCVNSIVYKIQKFVINEVLDGLP